MIRCLFVILCAAILLSSCNLNKDIMFQTDRDYVFDESAFERSLRDSAIADSVRIDSLHLGLKIAPFDILNMEMYSNDGALIYDFTTSTIDRQRSGQSGGLSYVVDSKGYVEMPVIGRHKLSGMTIPEAQNYLEKLYADKYNFPFCVLQIVNRRAIVFYGVGSTGTVVSLTNQNVSVVEAIALAGGIKERGNASKIKVIRSINGTQEVYRIDLSTIEGIRYSQMVVQGGDIIYVEPLPRLASEFATSVGPVLGLINSFVLLYFVTRRF